MERNKKILIVDINNEYGGGQVFLKNVLTKLSGELFYIVKSTTLYNELSNCKHVDSERLFEIFKEVDRYLGEVNPDVVILNGGYALFFPIFSKNKRYDFIYYKHATYKGVSKRKRFIFFLLINFSYFYAKRIICVSEYCKKEELFFKNKMSVIYHGIQSLNKNIHKDINKKEFLYVGRIVKEKGADRILDYFYNSNDEELTICVVGDYLKANFDVSKYLGCPRIYFAGLQTNVDAFYNSKSVFISLPTNEAFGLTLIEAMSKGMIVIAAKVGGIPEIIKNGVNGFLIKDSDMENFIDNFLKSNQNLENIERNALSTVYSKFTIEKEIENLEKIINEVIYL